MRGGGEAEEEVGETMAEVTEAGLGLESQGEMACSEAGAGQEEVIQGLSQRLVFIQWES